MRNIVYVWLGIIGIPLSNSLYALGPLYNASAGQAHARAMQPDTSTNTPASTTSTPPATDATASAASSEGNSPPTTSQSGSGTSTLGSASLSIADQLNLVTTSIWYGGIKISGWRPNLFITSTLAASKPSETTSTKYQDTELLSPNGGVLNLLITPFSTVNFGNYDAWTEAASKNKTTLGRDALSDRYYKGSDFGQISDVLGSKTREPDEFAWYFVDGIGVKMLNRNSDTTTTKDVSNYGIGAVAYAGAGFDVGLRPAKSTDPLGNIRAEFFLEGGWTDSVTMKTLYSTATDVKDTYGGAGFNFQLVITNKANVNLQVSWPIGRKYMNKTLLAGITLSR